MSANEVTKTDIDRLTNKIEFLTNTVENLIQKIEKTPVFIPISKLVNETGKARQVIRNHILNNYVPDEDFKVENGKMQVASNVFVSIKEYYDRKTK